MHAWCASIGLSTRLHTPPADYVQFLLSCGGCCLSSAKLHVLLESPSDACQDPFIFRSNSDSRTYISDVPNSGVTLFTNSRAKKFDRCLTIRGFVHSRRYVAHLLSFLAQLVCPRLQAPIILLFTAATNTIQATFPCIYSINDVHNCRNVDHAEETVIQYWSIYCPKALETHDFETLAKVHNGRKLCLPFP
jgi:hypothetical protein